jgi:hypothetical protein
MVRRQGFLLKNVEGCAADRLFLERADKGVRPRGTCGAFLKLAVAK